ncbi:hypothetical protein Hanom_Chr15g01390011 [Helianthus anomalus]
MGGSQTSLEIETVPETQPEPEPEPVCRGMEKLLVEKVSQKKETSGPHRKGDYLAWTKRREVRVGTSLVRYIEGPYIGEFF